MQQLDGCSLKGMSSCLPMPEGTGSRFYTGMAAAFGAAPKGWNVEDLAGHWPKTNRIE